MVYDLSTGQLAAELADQVCIPVYMCVCIHVSDSLLMCHLSPTPTHIQPDTVNDAAFHPFAGLVAVGTGQRHFPLPHHQDDDGEDEEGEDEEHDDDKEERRKLIGGNRITLYRISRRQLEQEGGGEAMEEAA